MSPVTPRRRRTVVAAASVAALALLASACGDDGSKKASEPNSASGSAGSSAPAGAAKPGGTLTFALASDPTCVDPHQAGSNDSIYPARQLVASLTDQDPKTGAIVPWLAASWEVSADATSFTFHLAPGLTFSDGTAINAQSVKDNFDSILKLGAKAPLGTSYLAGYKDTTVVNDTTAKVNFSKSSAAFLQATSTHSLGLLAESTLAKAATDRCSGGIVGSGPFVLDHYTPNQEEVLKKRAGYTAHSATASHQGDAYLDQLVFKVIPEQGVRTGALKSGQVLAIGGVSPQDEPSLKSGGFTVQARPNPGIAFNLQANTSHPISGDPAVRKAVLKAIDRQEVVDTVLSPSFKAATSILSSSTLGYADNSSTLAFDLPGAKKILDDAGWTVGSDGIRVKAGQKLHLNVTWFTNFGPNLAALELVQQQLKAAGIDVTLQQHTIAEAVQVQKEGAFDYVWGNLTRADPDVLRVTFSIKGNNASRLTAGDLETALDHLSSEGDVAARAKAAATAQSLILDNAYAAPVFELTTVLGLASKVHELRFDASSRLQIYDTWVG